MIERISEIDDILTFDSDISGENNCSDISLYCDRNAYLYKDSEGSIWRFELFVSNPDVQNFCVIHKKRVVADIGVRCFMCNETTVETATGRFDSVISLKDYIKYKPSDKLSAKYFTDGYGNIIENIPETINSGLYNKKYGLLQLHLFNNTDSNIVYNRIP
ncbi:MAG: hypothetical protein GC181_16160 [Bacteroidetes bacterium]|nr:hypothetical protein [Bacteroidota bacterium]